MFDESLFVAVAIMMMMMMMLKVVVVDGAAAAVAVVAIVRFVVVIVRFYLVHASCYCYYLANRRPLHPYYIDNIVMGINLMYNNNIINNNKYMSSKMSLKSPICRALAARSRCVVEAKILIKIYKYGEHKTMQCLR